jgi:hypothetical protein
MRKIIETKEIFKETEKKHPILKTLPVAKFFYKGSHSHPVRRTILVIENNRDDIVGYELREGNTVRSLKQMVNNIKKYKKSRIARYGDCSRLKNYITNKKKKANESTLQRLPLSAISDNMI